VSMAGPLHKLLRYRRSKTLPLDLRYGHLSFNRLSRSQQRYAGQPSRYGYQPFYAQSNPSQYQPSLFSPSLHWPDYQPYLPSQQDFNPPTQPPLNRRPLPTVHPDLDIPRDTIGLQRRLELLQDTFVDPEGDEVHTLDPPSTLASIDPDQLPEFSTLLHAHDQLKEVLPEDDPDLLNLTRAMWSHSMDDAPEFSDVQQALMDQQHEIQDHHLAITEDALPVWEIAEQINQEQSPLFEAMEQRVQEEFSDDHPDLPLLAQTLQRLESFPQAEIDDEGTSNLPPGDPYALTSQEEAEELFHDQLDVNGFSYQDMSEFDRTLPNDSEDARHEQHDGFGYPLEAMIDPAHGFSAGTAGQESISHEPVDHWTNDPDGLDSPEFTFDSPLEEIVAQETLNDMPITEGMIFETELMEIENAFGGVEAGPESVAMNEINQAIDQVASSDISDPMQMQQADDPLMPGPMMDPYQMDPYQINPDQMDPFGPMLPDPSVMPNPFGY